MFSDWQRERPLEIQIFLSNKNQKQANNVTKNYIPIISNTTTMQRNHRRPGRPRREPHKLCLKRLKDVKTVSSPRHQFNEITSNRNLDAPRRSQRLLQKHDDTKATTTTSSIFTDILCRYEQQLQHTERKIVRQLRVNVYKAAAAFDLISRGGTDATTMGSTGKKQQRVVFEEKGFPTVPPDEWVYSTPEQQKIRPVKVKKTQLVPALLHTTSRNKTLYEMREEFKPTRAGCTGPFSKMARRDAVEFDVGYVRQVAQFPMRQTEEVMQISPIVQEVIVKFSALLVISNLLVCKKRSWTTLVHC